MEDYSITANCKKYDTCNGNGKAKATSIESI